MKKFMVGIWLVVLVSGVGLILWYNQYIYSLPTPIPQNYKPVQNGTFIGVDNRLHFARKKPVLLHFFNPDCPCSRFNIKHVKELIQQYGNRVDFVVVLMNDKYYTPAQVQARFDLQIPVIADKGLAKQCGVYSTPQAVILKNNRQLYYRGNYNSSRYCTDTRSAYAQIALNALLKQQKPVLFSFFATRAYGCSLPGCNR